SSGPCSDTRFPFTLARACAAAAAPAIARSPGRRPRRNRRRTQTLRSGCRGGSGPYCGPAGALAGPQSSRLCRGGRRAGRRRPRGAWEGSERRLVELHDLAVDVLDDLAGGGELRQHVAGEELRDAHLALVEGAV